MPTDLLIRPMAISDGPAINSLARRCPDGGTVSLSSAFRENAFNSLQNLRPRSTGFGVESPRQEGLVGMAWLSSGHCRIESETVPYALLHSLMVHPDWRRQGIAEKLSRKAIEYVTARLGHRVLMVANIQAGNAVSHRTAGKWSNQILPAITVAPVRVRRKKPGLLSGVTFEHLKKNYLEFFAQKLNHFYEGYNLFKPETADSLSDWLSQKPLGPTMHHCLTATDRRGRLLAGLALEEAYRLRTYQIAKMPAVLRIANRLMHVIPADGTIREILVSRFWFGQGNEEAARCLFQKARWEYSNRCTSLMAFFDPRCPLNRVVGLKPWSLRTAMNTVIRWQIPASRDRPLYPIP